MLQLHPDLWPGRLEGEPFGPFQNSHGGGREDILHAQSLKIVETLNAVQIGVVDLGGLAIDVNEREGWAGDVVFVGGPEAGNDAFG